jgi:hypothetical protein
VFVGVSACVHVCLFYMVRLVCTGSQLVATTRMRGRVAVTSRDTAVPRSIACAWCKLVRECVHAWLRVHA